MELFEAIKERHSYRGAFKPQPVPEKDLRKIVQAGLDAPSGKNLQTTQFVIINQPDTLSQVKAVFAGQPFILTAPAFIATIIDTNRQPAPEYAYTFEIEDNAAATQNLLLAITGLGYASVWLDGALRDDQRAEKIGKAIGLPESKHVGVLLPVGVPTEAGSRKPKLQFAQRAWFNQYASAV